MDFNCVITDCCIIYVALFRVNVVVFHTVKTVLDLSLFEFVAFLHNLIPTSWKKFSARTSNRMSKKMPLC